MRSTVDKDRRWRRGNEANEDGGIVDTKVERNRGIADATEWTRTEAVAETRGRRYCRYDDEDEDGSTVGASQPTRTRLESETREKAKGRGGGQENGVAASG